MEAGMVEGETAALKQFKPPRAGVRKVVLV